jgi:O-antigen/teichoic acid export membrane protein
MHLLGPITLQRIAIFFLGCSLFTSLIPLFMGWARVSTIRHRSAAAVREIILFGRYSMGTYLCSTVFKHSDSIIIKFMIGPAALAIYNLAQRLLEVIEIPIRSLLGTAMPAMSVAYNNNENAKVSHIMKKYTGALTIILVPIIIAAFVMADVIVEIIGGQKYVDTEAANVFRLLICSAILYPIDRFSGITLDIIHKPHLNFVKIVLSLVVNVVVDIIAIKILGNVYGVAAASIVTILFGVGFGYITLNRYLPFNLHGILKLGYIESRTMVNGFLRKKPVL